MEISRLFNGIYKNRKVLITGHTGFKGSWLCKMLIQFGAEVSGYALAPDKEKNLFTISKNERFMESNIGDIRDLTKLEKIFNYF